jgi:hypothetical protein
MARGILTVVARRALPESESLTLDVSPSGGWDRTCESTVTVTLEGLEGRT